MYDYLATTFELYFLSKPVCNIVLRSFLFIPDDSSVKHKVEINLQRGLTHPAYRTITQRPRKSCNKVAALLQPLQRADNLFIRVVSGLCQQLFLVLLIFFYLHAGNCFNTQ